MPVVMEDQRTKDALLRIERALDRVEKAAAGQKDAARAEARRATDELERLRAAHALLRGRVEDAVGEIDRMLAPGRRAEG